MDLTDKEYVERCRDGHPEDFRLLVHRYQGPLFSYLTGRLGDRSEAEEAAQESFVRAFLSLNTLRKPESFYSWPLGIAGRVAKEQFRSLKRRQQDREVAETMMANAADGHAEYPLDEAIAVLPETYRQVILLWFYEELSCQEVAQRTRNAARHGHKNALASLHPASSGASRPRRRGTNSLPNGATMNCVECRDNLVACIERLLDHEESLQCEAHLEACASCRAEYAAIAKLQQRLVAHGQVAAGVSIVEPVMRRVLQQQTEQKRNTIMSKLFTRWGLGLSAATAGAAAIILIIVLASPKTQATAAEVIAKGARAVANLSSIHLRGQLRTAPAENFGHIDPAMDFVPIELWKQFEPELKWRVEKYGRIAVMDGQSTVLYVKTVNTGMKVPHPSSSAFDTQWLHEMADVSGTLKNELTAIKAHGWPVTLTSEQGVDGNTKSVITVEAKSGLPDSDYLKNKFFETSDTRRVYVFDNRTDLLESVKIYLHAASGDKLIFELNQIDYNQPPDPGVFHLELPANVNWY